MANGGDVSLAARSDYAANGGDLLHESCHGVYYGHKPTWSSAPSNGDAGPASVNEVEYPRGSDK